MQAALPVAPDTTLSIAADLCKAEASMPGGSFVGFQGTQQLYTAMLDKRQQQASARIAHAGACSLSGLFRRAKVFSHLTHLPLSSLHEFDNRYFQRIACLSTDTQTTRGHANHYRSHCVSKSLGS